MDDKLAQLADTVTAPLKDDPELRLDVRREVLSHLEDTAAALQAEGAEEPEADAARAFGAPEEIAGELLEANKARMKWRALARLCLRGAVVPVALALVVLVGVMGLMRVVQLVPYVRCFSLIMQTDFSPAGPMDEATRIVPGARDSTRLQQMWQEHPEQVAYLGYSFLCRPDDRLSPRQLAQLETDVRQAEQADPGNALYSYVLAHAYLNAGMEYVSPPVKQTRGAPPPPREPPLPAGARTVPADAQGNEYLFGLRDRAMLERAAHELQRGMAMPALRRYHREMLTRRLAALRPSGSPEEDHSQRFGVAMDEWFPEGARLRDMARRVPGCAEFLIAEGHRADADPLARFHERMAVQLCGDAYDFLDVQVAQGIATSGATAWPKVYGRLNEPERGAQLAADLERLRRPFAEYKARLSKVETYIDSPSLHEDPRWTPHAGLMATLLLPSMLPVDQIHREDLAPTRELDYLIAEHAVINAVLALLGVVLLIVAAFGAIGWLKTRRREARPLLLLPTWRDLLAVLGYGVLLPLALYALYTHSPIGGREYGLPANRWRFLIEIVLLSLTLVILPVVQTNRALGRRCRALGLVALDGPSPFTQLMRLAGVTAALLAGCAALAVAAAVGADYVTAIFADPVWAGATIFALLLALAAFLVPRVARRPGMVWPPWRGQAAYLGTLARSGMVVLGLATALLAGITAPYFHLREAAVFRADPLFFGTPNTTPFGYEDRVVRELRDAMLREADALARDRATRR